LEAREQKLEKIREEAIQKEQSELLECLQKTQNTSKVYSNNRIEDRFLAFRGNQTKKPQDKDDNEGQNVSLGTAPKVRGRFKSSSNIKNDLL